MPKFKEVKLEELMDLDEGRVAITFKEAIKQIVTDCIDRPGDSSARSVTLDLKIIPITDVQTGQCDMVNGEFTIKSKVPDRRSKTYQFGVRRGGQLVFNQHAPQSIHQNSMLDDDEEGDDE